MDSIIVKGGPVLSGRVATSGAKNAALPVLISSLLADGTHTFERVPLLRDIDSTHQLLEALGCEFERDGTTVTVNTSPPAEKSFMGSLYEMRKIPLTRLCRLPYPCHGRKKDWPRSREVEPGTGGLILKKTKIRRISRPRYGEPND